MPFPAQAANDEVGGGKSRNNFVRFLERQLFFQV